MSSSYSFPELYTHPTGGGPVVGRSFFCTFVGKSGYIFSLEVKNGVRPPELQLIAQWNCWNQVMGAAK
jgi:hypothetical protein